MFFDNMSYQRVILLITVIGLYIPDVKLQELGSNRTPDPIQVSGTWYVGAISSSKISSKDIKCWTLKFSKAHLDYYTGTSNYFIRSTHRKISEPFNMRALRKNQTLYGFHVSMMYEGTTAGFDINSEIIEHSLWITSTGDVGQLPFRYLVLDRDLTSLRRFLSSHRIDLQDFQLVDHTECTSDVAGGNASYIHINPFSIFIFILFLFCNVYLWQH